MLMLMLVIMTVRLCGSGTLPHSKNPSSTRFRVTETVCLYLSCAGVSEENSIPSQVVCDRATYGVHYLCVCGCRCIYIYIYICMYMCRYI